MNRLIKPIVIALWTAVLGYGCWFSYVRPHLLPGAPPVAVVNYARDGERALRQRETNWLNQFVKIGENCFLEGKTNAPITGIMVHTMEVREPTNWFGANIDTDIYTATNLLINGSAVGPTFWRVSSDPLVYRCNRKPIVTHLHDGNWQISFQEKP